VAATEGGGARIRAALVAPPAWSWLARHVAASPAVASCDVLPLDAPEAHAAAAPCDVLVLRAAPEDLEAALAALAEASHRGAAHCVLISSARVHEPRHQHPGMVSESGLARRSPANPVARAWREVERRAREAASLPLTILRPTPWLGDPGDAVSRLFAARLALLIAGHDPSIQILAPGDLGEAVRLAVERAMPSTATQSTAESPTRTRIFHVAPSGTVPVRRGLALAGRPYLPLPHIWHRLGHALLARSPSLAEAQYLRYSWTVSGEAFERATGFAPATSAAALAGDAAAAPELDDFGQDAAYITRRRWIHFLHDAWWRVEACGLEHVPPSGPAVLVGVHRGFMPWDGVMTLERVRRDRGRFVRFLIHPSLAKPPYLAPLMSRLGGVIACRENGDRLLRRGDLLGVYPEGIRGAFTPYREAYRLGSFGRHDYARLALRRGAPIVPFVILGNAEIFPILGRVDWRWFRRLTEWPYLPLTPTFPLLPVPLPSKWHMLFLPPIDVAGEYPPAAADDPAAVRAVGERVRDLLGDTLRELRARRRHVFFGSIFERDAPSEAE
jgi:1-acyl-sn-glycerol-3-phosphate acyltransferase